MPPRKSSVAAAGEALQEQLDTLGHVARALKQNTSALGSVSVADLTVGLYYLYQQRKTQYESSNESLATRVKDSWGVFQDESFTLSKDQMENLLRKMNPDWTQEELDCLFDAADTDKNGVIDLGEFVDFVFCLEGTDDKSPTDSELQELLKLCDFALAAYGDDVSSSVGLKRSVPQHGETEEDAAALAEEASKATLAGLEKLGYSCKHIFPQGKFRKPAHFVATRGTRMVIGVRGTASLSDVMTDLECDQVMLSADICGTSSSEVAHAGFAASAEWLVGELIDRVTTLAQELGSQAELLVIGHSLGAGVASLAFLHFRSRLAMAGCEMSQQRCYAFAAPPCMGASLAAASDDLGITSIVLHDDIIPRLSQHNVERLRAEVLGDCDWRSLAQADFENSSVGVAAKMLGVKFDELVDSMCGAQKAKVLEFTGKDEYEFGDITKECVRRGKERVGSLASEAADAVASKVGSFMSMMPKIGADAQKEEAPEAQPALTRQITSAEVKEIEAASIAALAPILLPPGRVLYLQRRNERKYKASHVPNDYFGRIELSTTMLTDHSLGNYKQSLSTLCPA